MNKHLDVVGDPKSFPGYDVITAKLPEKHQIILPFFMLYFYN